MPLYTPGDRHTAASVECEYTLEYARGEESDGEPGRVRGNGSVRGSVRENVQGDGNMVAVAARAISWLTLNLSTCYIYFR